MFRAKVSQHFGIPINNGASPSESGSKSIKRRLSTTLEKMIKLKKTSESPELSDTNVDNFTEELQAEDNSSQSDEFEDDDAEDTGSEMEGHTNLQFIFDNHCHLDALEPEKVLAFPNEKRTGCLGDATDVKYIGNGRSLVVDMLSNRVHQFNRSGKSTITYTTGEMVEPWAVAINSDDVIHVTARKSKYVTRFSKSGEMQPPIKNTNLTSPSGIAIDKSNRIVVSDTATDTVSVYEEDGTFIRNVGEPLSPIQQFNRPRYVHMSTNDDMLVCDSGNHCIKVFDSNGNFVQKIGRLGKGEGHLKFPYGICTDSFGSILVADHYNDRVSFFSKSGLFIRHLVTSMDGLLHPQGLCITPNLRLLVTHGSSKAREVLVYDLRRSKIDMVTHDDVLFV